MKKMLATYLLILLSCTCFAQLADKLPDTLTKGKVCGSYVANHFSKVTIRIKPNHVFIRKTFIPIRRIREKGTWEIKSDTLYLGKTSQSTRTDKLIMHNEKLYFVMGSKADADALMSKSDYKYYQRQCKKGGH